MRITDSIENNYDLIGETNAIVTSSICKNEVESTNFLHNYKNTVNTEEHMSAADYMVAFSGNNDSCCIGLVDMVNSTKIAATLGNGKIARYYQIFLNSMSKIISRFGGQVIKNVGDCLLYYFPESSKSNRKYGFMSCLECSLSMIEYHDTICKVLKGEGLPCIDYRVSADYGSVVLMNSNVSSSVDMIGPPVNMCSKINHAAATNGVVIGGDLYSMVKTFEDYDFEDLKGFSLGFKYSYPLYHLSRG